MGIIVDPLQVSSTKVKYGLAMPILLRRWFLTDLHHMCVYFEENGGTKGEPAEFKKVVPNALSAEDWFRFHGRCTERATTIFSRSRSINGRNLKE